LEEALADVRRQRAAAERHGVRRRKRWRTLPESEDEEVGGDGRSDEQPSDEDAEDDKVPRLGWPAALEVPAEGDIRKRGDVQVSREEGGRQGSVGAVGRGSSGEDLVAGNLRRAHGPSDARQEVILDEEESDEGGGSGRPRGEWQSSQRRVSGDRKDVAGRCVRGGHNSGGSSNRSARVGDGTIGATTRMNQGSP
jgi:hypothetical protein